MITDYSNRSIYHFTHIDNLESIITYGLLSTSKKTKLGISHLNIAHCHIQNRRALMRVTCGKGGIIHDYVPFYFCYRSPMLYSVTRTIKDPENLIYLEYPINVLEEQGNIFTDISANTTYYMPEFYENTEDLAKIDWEAVDTNKWGEQYDPTNSIKRRKQAEALIYEELHFNRLKCIVVQSSNHKEKVESIFSKCGISETNIPKININREYFF